jgi:DNA-binding transcriptional MerR regulator
MNQLDLFSSIEPPQPPHPEPEKPSRQIPAAADAKQEEVAIVPPPEEKASPVVGKSNGRQSSSPAKKRGRRSLKELADDPEILRKVEETPLEKQYYSISEVSEMFRVNTSLIRYWENEFDVLKPKKNRKGDRLFRPEDIHNLRLIYHLLRERKYTIEGAKQKLKEEKKLAMQNFELVQSLLKVRKFLTELKEQF